MAAGSHIGFNLGNVRPTTAWSHRGSTGPAEPLFRTTVTTNMAAANFVVITNGERYTLTGTADIDLHCVSKNIFEKKIDGFL